MSTASANSVKKGSAPRAESAPGRRISVVGALQEIQRECGYLPRERLLALSRDAGIALARLYSVATFYHQFSLKPKGRNVVTVCTGTACHVRGCRALLEKLEEMLAIRGGETTPDGMFTLETVNCLGACALGPLISVNGKYYGKMTPSRLEAVMEGYRAGDNTRKA
jgi:NADH-quinone oxidoreductase subunit E